jgi:transcriptional regulator with PAS, ATPase and Fis domain
MSRDLLESELFGHEKGAFTGATTAHVGLVAASHGGTLFLDEISEMPAPMQVSLLRFLDRHEYRPVGGTRTLHADVRIVAATNQDLQSLIARGGFRDDLFYRINTVTLRVPPLRERKDDLASLTEHILRSLRISGAPHRPMTAAALERLKDYHWPGNVRELRNVIERVVLMNPGTGPITGEEVGRILPISAGPGSYIDSSSLSLDEIEHAHIQRVLAACGGNKTHAAKTLRIDYKTLLTKLKQKRPPSGPQ